MQLSQNIFSEKVPGILREYSCYVTQKYVAQVAKGLDIVEFKDALWPILGISFSQQRWMVISLQVA